MTRRAEFTKPVKREALKRSGGRCEASGPMYGYAMGHRCNADLSYGVEFDHIVLEANSHDNGLENCAAVCIRCHRYKTAKHDTPVAAKTVRQRDKHDGIRGRNRQWPKRSFRDGYKPNVKQLNEDMG